MNYNNMNNDDDPSYYLNLNENGNPNNKQSFIKRARDIGFKGKPLRNNKPTKSFTDFLNKKFQQDYEMKNEIITKDLKISKKFTDKKKSGGYYIKEFNQFLKDKKPFKINLEGKSSIEELLNKVRESKKQILLTFTMSSGKKRGYILNRETIERLKNTLILENQQIEEDSDSEFKQFLQSDTMSEVEVSLRNGKKKPSGGFFKYTHNINGLDLSDFQIYNNISELEPNAPCCFIQSLISAGVEDSKINEAKHLIKQRSIPTCLMNEICKSLSIHITIKKYGDIKNVVHYPTAKCDITKSIREKEPIKIGLIDEHYFHIKECNITNYALTNYESVKDINDFHKIRRIKDGKYDKSNIHYINSYRVISYLYANKDKLLTPISLCDEIFSTQYVDKITEIVNLEYNENNTKEVEYIDKEEEADEFVNVFADFETSTEGNKHTPYMCCISTKKKIFYGEDCGKQMLYFVSKYYGGKNIRIIFHNAGYDVRFLYQYIHNYYPIERGKFLLRAYGNFYYSKGKKIKIQIQDSYALIPSPLRDFGKMFNLTIKKEILPYNLYTQNNIDEELISLDKCIEAVKLQYSYNNIGKKKDKKELKQFISDFIDNCNNWDCVVNGKIDIIKYSKEYCAMDVEVVKQGYNTFKNNILEITGINIDNYVSLASVALDYMKKAEVFEGVYELSGIPREFINKCMIGGRTMTCENKKIDNPKEQILADFDAVSLYPSAMEQLGGYLKGKPKILKKEELNYEFLEKQDGYFVEIIIEEVNKHYKFPLMSKVEEGIRNFTNNMENEIIYVDKITLNELINRQKIKYKINRGYYYNEGRNYKLKDIIRHLFNSRLEAKKQGNPIQNVYKLLMNSAYGKCLLKPIDTECRYISDKDYNAFVSRNYNWIKETEKLYGCDSWRVKMYKPINEHYNLVHCGVEVLSSSKRIMNSVMCLAEDLNIDMYYTDTDSIHIDNSKIELLANEFEKINNRKLIGKNMGQFHTDFDSNILEGEILAKRSIFLGKKCYIDELYSLNSGDLVDYHIRLKGIPNASILDYCFKRKINPYELYERLYNGEEIIFDLTCGGKKINFKFNNDMTITTLDEFNRKIMFL